MTDGLGGDQSIYTDDVAERMFEMPVLVGPWRTDYPRAVAYPLGIDTTFCDVFYLVAREVKDRATEFSARGIICHMIYFRPPDDTHKIKKPEDYDVHVWHVTPWLSRWVMWRDSRFAYPKRFFRTSKGLAYSTPYPDASPKLGGGSF